VTGRYALQGVQLRAGLELWAARAGAGLLIEDDRSSPERAAEVHARLLARGCAFVLGPYGGDCARALARAAGGAVVWNHGAAADDVQQLPGVLSVCSPASRYLVALARAVVALRAGARVALVTARAPFGRLAREGLQREAPSLGLSITASFSFFDPPELIAARCHQLAPDDPRAAARVLRTTTFYGAFELDPLSGIQRGHRLCVVRWRGGRQQLLLTDAA
jgi:ABC-type branched-subunit amino acid transport system substrate-binding protein